MTGRETTHAAEVAAAAAEDGREPDGAVVGRARSRGPRHAQRLAAALRRRRLETTNVPAA
jgi:hypothetical protein